MGFSKNPFQALPICSLAWANVSIFLPPLCNHISLSYFGDAPGTPPLPHGPNFSQLHAVFFEIFAKLYVGALATENPGFAPELVSSRSL